MSIPQYHHQMCIAILTYIDYPVRCEASLMGRDMSKPDSPMWIIPKANALSLHIRWGYGQNIKLPSSFLSTSFSDIHGSQIQEMSPFLLQHDCGWTTIDLNPL